MQNYARMYKEFDDARLLELARNVRNLLKRPETILPPTSPAQLAVRGMYATETLKDRANDTEDEDMYALADGIQNDIFVRADGMGLLIDEAV